MTTQHFPPPLFNHGSTKEAYTFNNAIPVTVAAISVDSMQFLLRYLVDASFLILWLYVGFGSMILYRFHSGDWDNFSVWTSKPSNISNAETVSDLGTDFNVHHESCLGSSRTDHVGRMVHTFALMHVLIKLLLQLTRIPGMSRTIIPRPFKLAMYENEHEWPDEFERNHYVGRKKRFLRWQTCSIWTYEIIHFCDYLVNKHSAVTPLINIIITVSTSGCARGISRMNLIMTP